MKTPLKLPCGHCGSAANVPVRLGEHWVEFRCRECGKVTQGSLGAGVTIGQRIMARALHELNEEGEASLAIVFAAMAFECEMASLHHRWAGIEILRAGQDYEEEDLDEKLRSYGSVKSKIEKVGLLLHPAGYEEFSISTPDICEAVETRFPSLTLGSLAEGFQQLVFWPRNRIMHLGDSSPGVDDARVVLSISALGLRIWESMNEARGKRFDAEG